VQIEPTSPPPKPARGAVKAHERPGRHTERVPRGCTVARPHALPDDAATHVAFGRPSSPFHPPPFSILLSAVSFSKLPHSSRFAPLPDLTDRLSPGRSPTLQRAAKANPAAAAGSFVLLLIFQRRRRSLTINKVRTQETPSCTRVLYLS
jgi:hypothetical protein